MASSTVTQRRRKTAQRADEQLISTARKKEILGLILMVLAILFGLAIVTYSATDDAIARAFTFEDAFSPGNNRAENALGLIGAVLASLMVPSFLGYVVLIPAGLLFAWGYVFFRQRKPIFLPLVSILLIAAAFTIASLFGWLTIFFEADLSLWSGEIGLGLGAWLQRILGSTGSILIILLFLAITTLLLVDHDIQRTFDRIEDWLVSAKSAFSEWLSSRAEAYRENRAERKELRQEKLRERPVLRADRPMKPAAAPVTNGAPKPQPRPVSTLDLFRDDVAPPARKAPDSREPEMSVAERIQEEKADVIIRRTDVPDEKLAAKYEFPPIDLLDEASNQAPLDRSELEENKRILLDKLETHNIEISSINAIVGPTVTLYELSPAPGIKISRITALEDDLAMATAARGIRMIAPIPGKSAVGVEIPNRHRELVPIRDLIGTARFRDSKMELPIPIGKTIEGEVFMQDLTKLPHLLIAGATGSGKSVGLNALIAGLLYACHPANLKFVMIDPKKIELQQYAQIVGHYVAMPENGMDPIITDFSEALGVLKSCEREMEIRYDMLSQASVRGIKEYNKKLQEGKLSEDEGCRHLPYIVVIVDELADLMMTAGKEIEGPIARLAQMARAVGIHLVLATQRPSVDVITGLIKANFPARIAYQVASKIDSRTILDQNGAEGLVGNGDLLYMMGSKIIRLQGPFVSVEEVDRIVDFIADQRGPGPYLLPPAEEQSGPDEIQSVEDIDDLFDEAARIIVRSQQGSVSLLQRKLSVGYTRAARIVDQLEQAGIVGPFVGSKAREVLVESEIHLDSLLKANSAAHND